MAARFVGIDPGINGAIAIIINDDAGIYDMPTKEIDGKKALDIPALATLLKAAIEPDTTINIERQQSMPSQGVSSTFKTGYNYGIIIGMLSTFTEAHTVIVTPRKWKAQYPTLKGLERKEQKAEACRLASELYPSLKDFFKRVKDNDRAEALLVARYRLMHSDCG